MYHLLCTDNDKDIQVYSITRRFLFTVKETVKDYVPVDSESVTHNMWVLPTLDQARQEFALATKIPKTSWEDDREELFD